MPGWVVKYVVSREDAPGYEGALEALAPAPSISAFAPEEGAPVLQVEAYFPSAIDRAILAAALPGIDFDMEPLPDVDWVSHSQSMLPPITAGRFHVYGAHVADTLKPGQVGLWIEANQAFGTGRHETTYGCLMALDWLLKRRDFKRALDLGCGSGVLGLGLAKAAKTPVVMSDIDPVSIDVALENAALNGVRPSWARAHILTANGVKDRRLRRAPRYDLVMANILARPLQLLAKDICAVAASHGIIVLAGLLKTQEAAVLSRYRSLGWFLSLRIETGEWPTLILMRRRNA